MIEHWYHEINENIKRKAGVSELYLDDHDHDHYETYCENIVLFFMFGSPRAGYDFGLGMVNDFIVQDIQSRFSRMVFWAVQ